KNRPDRRDDPALHRVRDDACAKCRAFSWPDSKSKNRPTRNQFGPRADVYRSTRDDSGKNARQPDERRNNGVAQYPVQFTDGVCRSLWHGGDPNRRERPRRTSRIASARPITTGGTTAPRRRGATIATDYLERARARVAKEIQQKLWPVIVGRDRRARWKPLPSRPP